MFDTDSIKNKLKRRTIEAIRILANRSECVEDVLEAMGRACHVHKIAGKVQFKEWHEIEIDGREGMFIALLILPSPQILEEAFDKEFCLCTVNWVFLLPHPDHMAHNDRPKNTLEWLSLGEVNFQLDEGEDLINYLNGLSAVGY